MLYEKHSEFSVHVGVPKTRSLSLNFKKNSSDAIRSSLDLIHDDWFGLAPLASPESLSEVSSISSRASFTNLENLKELSGSYELKTPKVMRRTLKIESNLSTCADDIRNVKSFQKLGQCKYLRRPSVNESASSSNLSYESASSSKYYSHEEHGKKEVRKENGDICKNEDGAKEEKPEDDEERSSEVLNNTSGESDDFQSAENILDSVIESAGCSDFFNSKTTFLETHFDETMFESEQPKVEEMPFILTKPVLKRPNILLAPPAPRIPPRQPTPEVLPPPSPQPEIDPDAILNFAIDLTLDEEHRSVQFNQLIADTSKSNSIDSGSACRTPSETKFVTFNPQVINIDAAFVKSTTPSPRRPKKLDRWHLLPLRPKVQKQKKEVTLPIVTKPECLPKTILCPKRRNSDEEFFSRTEALPLLSGLSNVSDKNSPNFVRRKKYVYPSENFTKNESSV